MERKPDESFANYKIRRAASNAAVRMLNFSSKGGTVGTREKLRSVIKAGRQRGVGITRAAGTRRSKAAALRAAS